MISFAFWRTEGGEWWGTCIYISRKMYIYTVDALVFALLVSECILL